MLKTVTIIETSKRTVFARRNSGEETREDIIEEVIA
jgi:hypothetical protein